MNLNLRKFLPLALAILACMVIVAVLATRFLAGQLSQMGNEQEYTLAAGEHILATAQTERWGKVQLWSEADTYHPSMSHMPGLPLIGLVGKDTIFREDDARLEWSVDKGNLLIWSAGEKVESFTSLFTAGNQTLYWSPTDTGETGRVEIRLRVMDVEDHVVATLTGVLTVDADGWVKPE